MSSQEFPPLDDLLRHRGAALLLDEVVDFDSTRIECAVTPTDRHPYLRNGVLPALVCVEFMAQAVGAHAGLALEAQEGRPAAGYLIGVPTLSLHVDVLTLDVRHRVIATTLWNDRHSGSYSAQVIEAANTVCAEGRVTVFRPPEGALS